MSNSAAPASKTSLECDEDAIYRAISWKILPILLACYVVAYLDRVNVGFAVTQMKASLDFSDTVIGFAEGIMFIGYFLFEIPSNMVLERIGARKTLLRIMACWGAVAAATMWVQTPLQFYLARFALGIFEAGFFPGVILYFTYWYPAARRGRIIAIFTSGAVVANLIAGPLSGATMKFLDGMAGVAGWQWLYVTQGAPAIFLGIFAYVRLQDQPGQATWLSAAQRAVVERAIAAEKPTADNGQTAGPWGSLLQDPRIYLLALVDFLLIGATYTMVFWTPSLIKGAGVTDMFSIGLYAAVPSVVGVLGMLLMCTSSDLQRERRWHFYAATMIGVVGLAVASQFSGNLMMLIASLCVAVFGLAATTPLLLSACTEYLPKHATAIGIPLLTSSGILGAAVCPAVAGWISTNTASPLMALYFVIALFFVTGPLLLWALPPRTTRPAE